jgi:2',3'-cyclic-nucleotide 2'-phosphodiesterase (5'-nucleotidase family)
MGRQLSILQMNDTHGYLAEHVEMFRDGPRQRHAIVGGYARIKACFDAVRAERGADSVLALDNGDTLHGTYPAVHSQGGALIAPLNQLALDGWTVHWDFVYGPSTCARWPNNSIIRCWPPTRITPSPTRCRLRLRACSNAPASVWVLLASPPP